MNDLVRMRISDSIAVKTDLLSNEELLIKIESVADIIINGYRNGKRVYLCGNGGSASDAQHLAGELVGRFLLNRKAYSATALNTDTSVLTCIANDYDYDSVFERQVEAHVCTGDILIGISTSGNSENIYRAMSLANSLGAVTVGLLGKSGGKISDICRVPIIIPCDVTARVQECHILMGHIICEIVEANLAR